MHRRLELYYSFLVESVLVGSLLAGGDSVKNELTVVQRFRYRNYNHADLKS